MLEAVDLRKSYGATLALDGVTLQVVPGEVVGLLGPNGAGKTSLVSIVAGIRRPDAGTVHVGGVDVLRNAQAARQLIGFAPQDTGVYVTLSVRDNLRFFGGLAGLRGAHLRRAIDEVAHALSLDPLLGRRGSELSGGERRRLHAAIALVHRPRLVLLDEPTTGADVRTRAEILRYVRSLAAEGSAVVYSTHYLQEVEELDARVVFIDRGRTVANGHVADLVRQHGTSALRLTFEQAVPPSVQVDGSVVEGATVRIPTHDPESLVAQLVPRLGADVGGLRAIEVVRPSLESVFLSVTGRQYDDEHAGEAVGSPA
ncbi:MAG: ABC transporter ATP-binding protein [Actinobacteria bacterium]|nr:ABC transporter ATP-binding protein [Actinomycetota bacterium]